MITFGIIGNGFLGKATSILSSNGVQYKIFDTNPELCIPKHCTINYLSDCVCIFVCVPTPMNLNGSCNTDIVETVIQSIRNEIPNNTPPIIVRSTVPVGFCDFQGVHFMPEFLTEANWRNDFIQTKEWIIGLSSKHDILKHHLTTIFNEAAKCGTIKSSTIRWMTTSEAEAVKYFRNCFLATKISFCNEFKQFCDHNDVDYNNVIEGVIIDERIGKSHTSVPGPDGLSGYSGHCLVKDINSLRVQMRECGCNPIICDASITRNELIDRTNKDWYSDKYKGRVYFIKPN